MTAAILYWLQACIWFAFGFFVAAVLAAVLGAAKDEE